MNKRKNIIVISIICVVVIAIIVGLYAFINSLDFVILDFTDEMLEELKITNTEYEEMKNINIWYIDMENQEDFENIHFLALVLYFVSVQ